MATVGQLAKGVAKVALATVFTGPLAGGRELGVQALDIFTSGRGGGSNEKRVLDRVAKGAEAIAAGQGIRTEDARDGLEAATDIFDRHALTLAELTDLQMDPDRAATELLRRGAPELRGRSEAAEALCRRVIGGAYQELLADPALLPSLERTFQQGVLARLDALVDVPEQLRAVLAAVAKFGVVDINTASPAVFFSGGWQRLEDAYLSPVELFLRLGLGEDLQDFSPRPSVIAQVDTLLADPTVPSGWVVLEAEAGLGKTALMAYLAHSRRWAHHFTQRNRDDTTNPVLALKSLAAQLITACGLEQFLQARGLPDAAGRPDWFARLLREAARRRRAAGITDPLVLVVDGLDEAAPLTPEVRTVPLGLPEHLPDGVFILAARRIGEDTGVLLPEQGYRSIRVRADDETNLADLQRRVDTIAREPAMAKILAEHGVQREQFVPDLTRRCGGIWVYLQYIAVEIRFGRRAPDNLDGLPGSLWEYYRRNLTWARDQDPALWHTHRRMLATLGVVGEPVTVQLWCQLAGITPDDSLRRTLDGPWFPFLQMQESAAADTPAGRRYSVYHASVGDFLTGRTSDPEAIDRTALLNELRQAATEANTRIADQYLQRWGGLQQNLPGLQTITPTLNADDRYGLSHLASHLLAAHRIQDLHQVLAAENTVGHMPVNAWFDVHDRLGDLTGYLTDLSRARSQAEQVTDQHLDTTQGFGPEITLEIRYALIEASLASLASNIPLELLERLVTSGRWSATQAMAYVHRLHDPRQRVSALAEFDRHMALDPLCEALATARDINDDWSRAAALAGLAPYLSTEERPAVLGEALTAALDTTDEWLRAEALAGFASHLPDDLLNDALTATHRITKDWIRVRALANLAFHLPDDEEGPVVLRDALAAARDIDDDRSRAQALADLAPHLPTDLLNDALTATLDIDNEKALTQALTSLASHLPDDLLNDALSAARGVNDDGARARALAGLAPYLPTEERPAVFCEALTATLATTDDWARGEALAVLAPHLPTDLLNDALAAARRINDDGARVRALANLAPHLPDDLLNDALAAARGINDDGVRVWALAELAAHLPTDERPVVLGEALAAARDINDNRSRVEALTELATHLSTDERPRVLGEALAATQHINEWARGRALANLAPHLPDDLLNDALTAARAINDNGPRVRALAGLAPYLPTEERPAVFREALTATLDTTDDDGARAEAFANLAPYISTEESPAVLREALTAAQDTTDEWLRAEALAGLAPHLPDDLLNDALTAAQDSINHWARGKALAGLAPHLPDNLLNDALTATQRINEWARAEALAGFASHLPDDLLNDALSAARGINDDGARARALAGLAPYLPTEERPAVFREALTATLATTDDWARGEALAVLAPHLPDDLLNDALTATHRITEDRFRAQAVTGLAPHLPYVVVRFDVRRLLLTGSRAQLLERLGDERVVNRFGGPSAARGIVKAILDVARWWPSSDGAQRRLPDRPGHSCVPPINLADSPTLASCRITELT